MKKNKYTGINIQWPISDLIIKGDKTVETRTYPLPEQYLGEEMLIIETPGKKGKFKARIIGIIRFTRIFKYSSKKEFYLDSSRHFVSKNSVWEWTDKAKWGWELEIVKKFKTPIEYKGQKGIVYTKDITI